MIRFPAEEGIDKTTEAASQQATWLASILAVDFVVVPEPNGGIVFERDVATVEDSVTVYGDGVIRYHRFEGSSIVDSRTITIVKR